MQPVFKHISGSSPFTNGLIDSLQLGVRYSKLRGLEEKYPLEAEKAREELVEMWLEKDQNPTWEKLADAFEYAEQRALAKKIRETYNCERNY